MNKEMLKKTGIISGSIILAIYVLFLVVPLFLNGIAASCGHFITSTVKDTTGFVVKFENIRFVTTPKLTAGIKIGHFTAALPDGDVMLSLDNAYGKISLLPLLIKRIEIDTIGADNVSASLKVKKDGKFLLEDYLPKNESPVNTDAADTQAPMTELPLGLKLSNHLPDIHVKSYKLGFVDIPTNDEYYIQGNNFKIKDFILNRKIKLSTDGKIVLADKTPFNYNLKVFNKVMPDIDLNDLIFAPATDEQDKQTQTFSFNVIDIFKTINKNMLTANLNADVKTSGDFEDINIDGFINIDNISVAKNGEPLPAGHINFTHKGKQIEIDSALYTAKDETTSFTGNIKTGKNPHIDINCKSNASFNNIFRVIDSIAKSVNYTDLDTLTATGGIDADFNIKADKKAIHSNGYFKIPSASIRYGLYNVLIDKIFAHIDFANDMVSIKDVQFTVMNQPLKAYGTIQNDTTSDLHLTADKLPIKGLVTAAGQLALLKENNIKSGTLSLDAALGGNFKKLEPVVDLYINNVNVLNIPSNTTVKLADSKFNLSASGNSYKGVLDVNSVQILNPMADLSIPAAKVSLDENDIVIDNTYLMFDNSRIDISGKIEDYIDKNIAINIVANGELVASDLRSLIPADLRSYITASGKIPVYVNITGNDKTQLIKAQVLATPANYLNIIKADNLSGKNTLLVAVLQIKDNSLKFSDTGLYTTSVKSLPASQMSEALISVTGSVDELASKQILNNVKVNIPSQVSFEIPGFSGSKAAALGDITLNGSVLSPSFKGKISVPDVEIPQIKTSLKNITVNMNSKSINVNTPKIVIDNSIMRATTDINPNFTNGVIVTNLDYHADNLDSDTLISAMAGMPAQTSGVSASAPSSNSSSQNLGVVVQKGRGTITKFKSGGITAENLTSDLSLKNNVLYLNSLQGNAFSGKFNGDVSVNLISGATNVDFTGTGMNAENAVAGAAGLKNALSGTLGFNAKVTINAYAPDWNGMMKSLKGSADFDIQKGTYGNIGRLENLLYAQNIISNGILSAALTPIVNMPVVKSTANFESLTGNMTFDNGWVNLLSVKSAGPSMSAFIYGKYNLVNASANVTILGRLGADVVKVLGPVGELSAAKLTSYLPKFGTATLNILNALTTNPNGERTAEIPALTGGNTQYNDFKVLFNGGVESKSSVKSFKWLSVCDTSEIEGGSLKEQLQQSQDAINQLRQQKKEEVQQTVTAVKESAKQTSEDIKNQVQNVKDSIDEIKNLFKKPSTTSTPATESATTTTTTTTTTTAPSAVSSEPVTTP